MNQSSFSLSFLQFIIDESKFLKTKSHLFHLQVPLLSHLCTRLLCLTVTNVTDTPTPTTTTLSPTHPGRNRAGGVCLPIPAGRTNSRELLSAREMKRWIRLFQLLESCWGVRWGALRLSLAPSEKRDLAGSNGSSGLAAYLN